MDNENIIKNFPITIYGNLEKYNDVISKGRCRIFYKGANRNGTFITDDFAEKLIATAPYAPVKGIFDEENKDYSDHGYNRDEGRIYGLVPAEPNFAWEKHVDDDGIEREYACVDVLIYTALYEEANIIIGKSQSMELYSKSIKGDWQIIEGKKYYVFKDACFLGLQVLGDDTEPCFEGAAFYSLYQSIRDMVATLENDYKNFQNYVKGGKKMPHTLFRLSDEQKYEFLWSLLNSEVDEDGYLIVKYGICNVYDDYAVVVNYCDQTYERVYYTKNDETDSLEICKRKKCFIIDVDEDEYTALKALRQINGDTYACLDTKFIEINSLNEQISEISTKVEELNSELTTLTQERDDANAQYATVNEQLNTVTESYNLAQTTIATLTTERDSLAAFKKNVEDDAKRTIINSYADQLSDETVNSYLNNLDNYSTTDLDMNLTYEVKKAHPDIFSKNPIPVLIPKDEHQTGIESILSKYENKN